MTSLPWMWWQGYVTVHLRGPGIEQVLNRAAEAGVVMLRVERLTSDVVIVRITARDFRRLRPLFRETVPRLAVSVSVLERHGAPFLLRRFKRRLFLAVGFALAALFAIYLSNFVWFIEVVGNSTIDLPSIRAAVAETGLKSGVPKRSIDAQAVERHLLERLPSLAWSQIKTKGVKVEIHLVERDTVETDGQQAGHVYAKRDGLVTEILVLQGTPQVREGDTVLQDDLLISGMYYDRQGRRQFGAARGIVKARVWYQAVGEASLVRWEPQRTGKRHRQYVLTVGPLRIPLGRSYPQETHLENVKNWRLYLGSAMAPLSWSRIEYEEVEWMAVGIPVQEAEQAAYLLAWESLLAQGVERESVIQEKTAVDYVEDGEGIRVTVRVEVVEDIGQFLGQ